MEIRKKVLSAVMSGLLIFSAIAVTTPVYAEKAEAFENGDFSDGTSGWVADGSAWEVKGAFSDGNNKAMYFNSGEANGAALKQALKVKKNTGYVISFIAQGARKMQVSVLGADGNLTIAQTKAQGEKYKDSNAGGDGNPLLEAAQQELFTNGWWFPYEYYFNSGDNDEVVFEIKDVETSAFGEARWFDNFTLTSRYENIINGGFEYNSWEARIGGGWCYSVYNVLTNANGQGEPASGSRFAQLWGKDSTIYQPVSVEPNTDYEVSVKYKKSSGAGDTTLGIQVATGFNVWTLLNADIADKDFSCGDDWKEARLSFNSGDNTLVYVGFVTKNTSNCPCIDDAKITRSVGTLRDGGFESGTSGTSSGGWEREQHNVSTAAAHSGKYGGSWYGRGAYTYQTVKVKTGTTYKLSFWYNNRTTDSLEGDKLRIYVADAQGIANDLPVGKSLIGNPGDGKLYGKAYPQRAEWTKVEEYFNTVNNSEITLVVKHDNDEWNVEGTNSKECYFDDFELTEMTAEFMDGDFESGSLSKWSSSNASVVNSAPSGKYAVQLSGSDQAKLAQTIYVERGKDYTLTYRYKNDAYGHNLSVYDSTYDASSTTEQPKRIVPIKELHEPADGWVYESTTFNSGDNDKITIEVKNCSADAVAYFDDFRFGSDAMPYVINSRVLGYAAEGKTLCAYADGIDMKGDTLKGLAYIWQESADGTNWQDISGANGSSYTVTDAAKKYRVGITANGTATKGRTIYSDAAFGSGKQAEFTADLLKRINNKVKLAPSSMTKENKSIAEALAALYSAADGSGVALSKENVTSFDKLFDILSDMASFKSAEFVRNTDNTVFVEFNSPIKTANLAAQIKLYSEGGEEIAAEIAPKDVVSITREDGSVVEYAKSITLIPSVASDTFVITNNTPCGVVYYKDVSIAEAKISVADAAAKISGNTAAVTAKINTSDFTGNILAISAMYDKDGKLLGLANSNIAITEENPSAAYSAALTIPENVNTSDVKIYIYAWSGTSYAPYTAKTLAEIAAN